MVIACQLVYSGCLAFFISVTSQIILLVLCPMFTITMVLSESMVWDETLIIWASEDIRSSFLTALYCVPLSSHWSPSWFDRCKLDRNPGTEFRELLCFLYCSWFWWDAVHLFVSTECSFTISGFFGASLSLKWLILHTVDGLPLRSTFLLVSLFFSLC